MAYGPYGPGGPQGGWGPRPPGPPRGGGYGPPMGGGYGPPPQWRQPRRKSGSTLAWVLGGFGLLAILGVGFIVVIAALSGGPSSKPPLADKSTGAPADTYSPTSSYSPTYSPSSPADSPTDPYSSESPSSTPSPTHSANTSRTKNSVYKAGALKSTRCPSGATNLHSTKAVRRHMRHLFHCLDKAWAPTLSRVHMENESPKSVLTSGGGRSPCGSYPPSGSGVPFYCGSNKTIYASIKAATREYSRTPGYSPMAVDSLFAHEYGHHVQNMTGILVSYSEASSSARESKRLGMSRRLELQASCFAGMFMRSVQGSYPIHGSQKSKLQLFNSNVGDWGRGPRNHGTPKHNGMWYKQGFDRKKAYQCNTWKINGSYTS